jgi:hypothetical protein
MMGVIDRTLKILCNHYPDWPRKLVFRKAPNIRWEPARLDINLAEKRFDHAYRIIGSNDEEQLLFVEFLFGENPRELFNYGSLGFSVAAQNQ